MVYLMYKAIVYKYINRLYLIYNIFESNATMFTNIFNYINPKEVLTNLPDAVFVVDSDGKIVWVNDKASVIFETKKTNLKGLFFNELVSNGLELAAKSFSRCLTIVTRFPAAPAWCRKKWPNGSPAAPAARHGAF